MQNRIKVLLISLGLLFPLLNTTVKAESTAANEAASIVEILPEDFKPAFTRDTVIRLNAIVQRSYTVIAEFDELTKPLPPSSVENGQRDIMTGRHPQEEQWVANDRLQLRSKAARADMTSAVDALKAGNEYYNAAVLAGMSRFVRDVEQEISRFQQNRLRTES